MRWVLLLARRQAFEQLYIAARYLLISVRPGKIGGCNRIHIDDSWMLVAPSVVVGRGLQRNTRSRRLDYIKHNVIRARVYLPEEHVSRPNNGWLSEERRQHDKLPPPEPLGRHMQFLIKVDSRFAQPRARVFLVVIAG